MEINSNISEICGAIIGDGWIESRETALYITGNKVEDKDYYDFALGPLFSETFLDVQPKLYPYWSVYGFHIYNQNTIRTILQLGIPKGYKADIVEFPDWVFSSEEIMSAAIRGYFDTDGNFSCKRCYGKYDNKFRKKYHCQPRIEIVSISKNLILQTYYILNTLGITPSKVSVRKGGFICNKKCQDAYRIRIDKLGDIKLWFEELRLSSNPKHITKYQIWKKFSFCPPKTTLNERKEILNNSLDPYSYY